MMLTRINCQSENLFVLRSLTKSFGLAGIRIGYAGASKQIIDILGLPAKVIKSDAEVAQIREERAANEQAQMEQQQLLAETQAAKQAAPLAKVIQDGSQ